MERVLGVSTPFNRVRGRRRSCGLWRPATPLHVEPCSGDSRRVGNRDPGSAWWRGSETRHAECSLTTRSEALRRLARQPLPLPFLARSSVWVRASHRSNSPGSQAVQQAAGSDGCEYHAHHSPHVQRDDQRQREISVCGERNQQGHDRRGEEQPAGEPEPVTGERVHVRRGSRYRTSSPRGRPPNVEWKLSAVIRHSSASAGDASTMSDGYMAT